MLVELLVELQVELLELLLEELVWQGEASFEAFDVELSDDSVVSFDIFVSFFEVTPESSSFYLSAFFTFIVVNAFYFYVIIDCCSILRFYSCFCIALIPS